MSSSDSDAVAQEYISIYEEVASSTYCTLAIVVLLAYDTLLSFGRERQYVWQKGKTKVSRLLYAYNRYMPLLYFVLNLGTIPPMSDTSCASLVWLSFSIQILSMLGPAAFTTLRIYALSRQNKVLGGIALLLSLTPFLINAGSAYQTPPMNLPAPINCSQASIESQSLYMGLVIGSRSCLILVDSLAVIVTWHRARTMGTRATTDTLRRRSLEQVMWRNGNIYFCTLVTLNVVDMAFVILSITALPGGGSFMLTFIDPISSVLNSRFLLDLHETNARLEGADGSISSFAVNIDGNGETGVGSATLPQFLGSLGGPVHSFPEYDFGPLAPEASLPSVEEL